MAKDDSLEQMSQSDTERHREAMVESHKTELESHKTQATLVTNSVIAVIALSDLLVPEDPRYTLVLAGILCDASVLYESGDCTNGTSPSTASVRI